MLYISEVLVPALAQGTADMMPGMAYAVSFEMFVMAYTASPEMFVMACTVALEMLVIVVIVVMPVMTAEFWPVITLVGLVMVITVGRIINARRVAMEFMAAEMTETMVIDTERQAAGMRCRRYQCQ